MNTDVNILHDENNSTAVTKKGINRGSKRRSDVSEETITVANEVIRDTEECSWGSRDEHKVTDVESENDNEKESATKNPHEVLKTQLECRSRRCKNPLGNAEENNDMLACSNCKSKFHCCCTNLPAYQIAQFVLVKSYGKYLCVFCFKIPKDFLMKSARRYEAEFEQVVVMP